MFSITLTGPGISIEREVSANKVAAIMGIIIGSSPSEAVITSTSNIGGIAKPEKVSLREFLDEAKAITKPDQIVAIGHYMAVHEGKDIFSREDIKARFQSARERLPSNFPRDFNVAISKAMIADDHLKSGHYYVTKTGIQAVERHFGAKN
ncbi:hypothetical protein [Bosea sp. 685]|uniref:hypothetical protein n=1 Tax=Bosea sp. 685 TaxID=3080057 RepID=UPI002892C8EF|nr:hypothetical protein [Bosea sp. 685]WNJ92924.1 hypothetical protein RMR04_11780 [Bosea sp. 685]